MRKGRLFNRSIAVVLVFVSVCSIVVVIMSMINLPEIKLGHSEIQSRKSSNFGRVISGDANLGKFGEMMVEMLPVDLAFTVFLPSERAFDRDLRLRVNHSFAPENLDDTYATVSRILGYSAVPRKIYPELVPVGKELSFDSVSGFALNVWKDLDGVLLVNGVRSEGVVLKKGEVVVHIMDGVIMDAEFEQSVRVYEEEK